MAQQNLSKEREFEGSHQCADATFDSWVYLCKFHRVQSQTNLQCHADDSVRVVEEKVVIFWRKITCFHQLAIRKVVTREPEVSLGVRE